ncbi:MAG: hypothetical protein EXS67_06045 [Candidatus Margulisbacteria bacterium]|nr:hypothetical protein [Candidatus Margulisiibacteriota bacterium]
MIIKTDEYRIECIDPTRAVIIGSLRLPTPSAYEPHFKPIKDKIEKLRDPYTINITKVSYLNSSGITAFANLIFFAKEHNVPLIMEASKAIPWQEKTMSSLEKLWSHLSIQFI